MKFFKIALVSFLIAVVVLIAALIIFLKTFDINRFKPQIISQATAALNRKVDFEKAQLQLSLSRGVYLRVYNLAIADDPAFAQGDFFTAKDISLSIDVWGYLFQKKVSVTSALIDGFRVAVIRLKDGRINVQSIAQPAAGPEGAQKPGKVSVPMALPAILVSTFKGSNGEVVYLDYTVGFPVDLKVSDLDFTLSKISLTDAFPFTLEGRVLSAQKNIHVEGNAQVALGTNEVTVSGVKAETDLSQVILEQVPVAFPSVKGDVLPVSLKGAAQVTLSKMTAGAKGMTSLAGTILLDNGGLKLKQMALPLEAVQCKATLTQARIVVEDFSASLGEGSVKGAGTIDDYLTAQEFAATFDAQKLHLEDLIARGMLPVGTKGEWSGKMQAKGKGFTPEALTASLTGTGTIASKNVVLEDVNVFQRVMDKLSVIPGLAEKFEAAIPERYKQSLMQKDTALSDMELPIIIENGRLIIKDTFLSAKGFALKGSAQAGFDGTYASEGSFLISDDLSADMVAKVSELQYLLNEDKQLFIPLKVAGKGAKVALSVDAGYLTEKMLVSQAKTQLLQVIDKALGNKEQAASDNTDAVGQPAPQPGAKEDDTGDLGSLIGSILKK